MSENGSPRENDSPSVLDLYPESTDDAVRPSIEMPKWTDIAIVVLTVGIVLFAFLQYLSALDAGHQTEKIIEADQRLASAMETSLLRSKESLDATIEQNRLDQRAWLGVEAIDGVPQVSHPFNITIYFKNTGKTPAVDSSFLVQQEPVKKGQLPTFVYRKQAVSSGITEPQATYHSVLTASPSDLTQTDVDALKSGSITIYVFGKITYNDVFGRGHRLTFCSYLRTDLTSYDLCHEYNDIDPLVPAVGDKLEQKVKR